MEESPWSGRHHILRVSRDEWVRQVFKVKKYYTAMRCVKGREAGSVVIPLKKVGKVDSIIGHGVIEGVEPLEEMSKDERAMCQRYGWRVAIKFGYLKRL